MAECPPGLTDEECLDWQQSQNTGGAPASPAAPAEGEGTWSKPYEFPTGSGQYYIYNSTTGTAKPFTEGPYGADSLIPDLMDMGLIPLDDYLDEPERDFRQGQARAVGRDPSTALTPEQFQRNTRGSTDPFSVDRYEELYYSNTGQPVPLNVRERILGQRGLDGGTSDPYAGAANGRAERALQESIRNNRLAEAEGAAAAIERRRQAMFNATMDAAQWRVPTGVSHFPGFEQNGALVRAGLAQPLPIAQTMVNPGAMGVSPEQAQIEADLQRIRGAAGVGR